MYRGDSSLKEAKKVFFIYLGEQWAFILLEAFALSWIICKNYIDVCLDMLIKWLDC